MDWEEPGIQAFVNLTCGCVGTSFCMCQAMWRDFSRGVAG